MAQTLVAYKIDVLEKLEELSRQMEEVNGKEKELETAQDATGAVDEELSLNVDKPADEVSMDALGDDKAVETGSEHSSASNEVENETVESPEAQGPGAEEGQSVSEDEVGINLGDDELWDDGDVEEIPLFEEELLSEISQEEEREKEAQEQSEESPQSAEEPPSHEAKDVEDTTGVELSGNEDELAQTEKGEEDLGEMQSQQGRRQITVEAPSLVSRLLPWIVTGLSSVLTLLAILTIYLLWNSSDHMQARVPENRSPAATQKTVKRPDQKVGIHYKNGAGQGFEAIDLAPFIIPGKSGGELVFFKLQVELVVPDATTKQELMRRQAWLRDIIYQELKGLDISRGVQGDILDRYRAPLLKRLNMEFSPLRIEDIRLMGYLLR